MLRVIILSFLLSVSCLQVSAAPCRALALSGGGSHGAYQAGVIIGLIQNLPDEDVQWDFVTGISAGSLNTAALSLFAVGDELNASYFLNETWSTLAGFSSVMENWPILGPIEGVISETGLFNSAPLKATLLSKFSSEIKRPITVGATNLQLGTIGHFNESIGPINMAEACVSSSSIPGVFPVQNFDGQLWVDGGEKRGVDTFEAIERCLTQSPEDEVILDVIFCSSTTLDPGATSYSPINVLYREDLIQSYDDSMWEVSLAQLAYPQVTFRYLVQPSVTLKGITEIDFRSSIMIENLEIGLNDGKKAATTGSSFDAQVRQWKSAWPNIKQFARA